MFRFGFDKIHCIVADFYVHNFISMMFHTNLSASMVTVVNHNSKLRDSICRVGMLQTAGVLILSSTEMSSHCEIDNSYFFFNLPSKTKQNKKKLTIEQQSLTK